MGNTYVDERLNRLDPRFIDTIIQIQGEWRKKHQEVPPQLFHYTTAIGLHGIIEQGSIRASAAAFLNDSTEVTHGQELIHKALDERINKNLTPIQREFFQRLRERSKPGATDFYVACFCAADDLLSQWRAYGNRGGYAIAFTGKYLAGLLHVQKYDFGLRRVFYDEKDKSGYLSELFTTVENLLGPVLADSQEDTNRLLVPLLEIFGELLEECQIVFKHPAFKEEEEWRLVRRVTPFEPAHFDLRESRGTLVPYVDLRPRRFAGINAGKLPIDFIRVGPTRHPETSVRGVFMLLHKNDYAFNGGLRVLESGVPLR